MDNLKPCPFCGKMPVVVVDDETETLFGVKCFYCGGAIFPEKETSQDAVDAWNKRSDMREESEWLETKQGLKMNKGLVIWGVEMPDECNQCPCFDSEYNECNVIDFRPEHNDPKPKDCPLEAISREDLKG